MSRIETKNIAKYSIMISGILVLSKIIGFVREFLVATQLGVGVESDVFKTATRIPNLFYSCVAAALVTSFIPIFSSVKNDKELANKFFNNIFNVVLILCSVFALLAFVCSIF
jgi:putative peptidoglycan lipid II flippase